MKNNYNEQTNISVDGHVLIKDMDTNEILLDKHNAINFQNFAFAVANCLANKTEGSKNFYITDMAFGYGGTLIDVNIVPNEIKNFLDDCSDELTILASEHIKKIEQHKKNM